MFNNIYFRATLIAFLTLFVCACSNTTTNGNSSNGQNPHLILEKNYIYIECDSTDNFTLAVKLGDKITYEKSIKAKSKLPIISLLKEKNEFYNDIAYLLSQDKGKININLSIPELCDTSIVYKVNKDVSEEHKCLITSGLCAKTTSNFEAVDVESDIIKWLYRNHLNNIGDSTINDIRMYLKELNRTSYHEYTTNQTIPVVRSLKDLQYKISSDLVADHYYLFACSSERDLEDFVEEMVSLKFEESVSSLTQSLSCFRNPSTSGLVCIFLVGINNDWSFQSIPAGLISIDNIKPTFGGHNTTIYNDKSEIVLENRQIKVTSKSDIPAVSGSIGIKYGKFEGYGYMLNVPFTFTFDGDIKKVIIHQTKNQTEEIDLSDKLSPYHVSVSVGLNTGDNYIPIDAIDARGNISTYDLKIPTERIKKDPVIENNIYN